LNPDEYILPALVVINLAGGFGCAVPIARALGKVAARPTRVSRYFAMLIGIYFIECVAFPAGMCTQIFTVGLAFVWGIVFGLWLRARGPRRAILKLAFSLALYGSLPTASLCILIPLTTLLSGRRILSAEQGIAFGIPDFFFWPLNTILGFFTALLIGTVVFKTLITTAIVNWLIGRAEKTALDGSPQSKDT